MKVIKLSKLIRWPICFKIYNGVSPDRGQRLTHHFQAGDFFHFGTHIGAKLGIVRWLMENVGHNTLLWAQAIRYLEISRVAFKRYQQLFLEGCSWNIDSFSTYNNQFLTRINASTHKYVLLTVITPKQIRSMCCLLWSEVRHHPYNVIQEPFHFGTDKSPPYYFS
jgi:hypothetical protein